MISLLIALLLPMPGPHIDSYIPLIAVMLHAPSEADAAFWVPFAILVVIYTAVAFGLLTLFHWLLRRSGASRWPRT